MAEGLLVEEGLFVLLVSDVFLHDILFHALCLLDVFPPVSRMEYILGRRPTYSAMGRPAHSSFILPKTFLFAVLWRKCFFE